jgi:hypothetical protein
MYALPLFLIKFHNLFQDLYWVLNFTIVSKSMLGVVIRWLELGYGGCRPKSQQLMN